MFLNFPFYWFYMMFSVGLLFHEYETLQKVTLMMSNICNNQEPMFPSKNSWKLRFESNLVCL